MVATTSCKNLAKIWNFGLNSDGTVLWTHLSLCKVWKIMIRKFITRLKALVHKIMINKPIWLLVHRRISSSTKLNPVGKLPTLKTINWILSSSFFSSLINQYQIACFLKYRPPSKPIRFSKCWRTGHILVPKLLVPNIDSPKIINAFTKPFLTL